MKIILRVFVGLCIGLFLITMVVGCGRNISSQEEAAYAASQLPDFGKLISVDSIYGSKGLYFRDTMKILGTEGDSQYIIHVIVYEKKDGKVEVVRFDEQRPPKIITVKKKSG